MSTEDTQYLYDMHSHLDFSPRPAALAKALEERGVRTLSCSTEPRGFLHEWRTIKDEPNVRMGLGLHPNWMSDKNGAAGGVDVQVDGFIEYAQETRYIAEVGMDYTKGNRSLNSAQEVVLEIMLKVCHEMSDKVISLHCVKAYPEMFALLESTNVLENCKVIFHWFSGSSDDLQTAIKMGCWFSVGERMLATGKGAEYVKVIPADKLLLETDMPAPLQPGQPNVTNADAVADQMTESLKAALAKIDEIRGCSMAEQIAKNSAELLEF